MDVFKGILVSAGVVLKPHKDEVLTVKVPENTRYVVGIDVSSRHSTVTILQKKPLQDKAEPIGKTFNVNHNPVQLREFAQLLKQLPGITKVVMEYTGRYYETLANFLYGEGFSVNCVNPLIIKKFGQDDLHKSRVKTDKADSRKIAQYGIEKYGELREYDKADEVRHEAQIANRELQFATKRLTASNNHLIALLEETFPGIKEQFKSRVRDDGHQKWFDFVKVFWHADCVRNLSLDEFSEQYKLFCKGNSYNFSKKKASALYDYAHNVITNASASECMQLLVQTAVEQVTTDSIVKAKLENQLRSMVSQLPEYETVMNMVGVGDRLGPQLIAEIGDIRRFNSKNSLAAFAGVDPGKNDSGDKVTRSNKTSKRGSPHLRRTLFLVCSMLLKNKPVDPVYEFLNKKREEGKHYYSYMTAGANKFLRVYYGKVRDALKAKGLWDVVASDDSKSGTTE